MSVRTYLTHTVGLRKQEGWLADGTPSYADVEYVPARWIPAWRLEYSGPTPAEVELCVGVCLLDQPVRVGDALLIDGELYRVLSVETWRAWGEPVVYQARCGR